MITRSFTSKQHYHMITNENFWNMLLYTLFYAHSENEILWFIYTWNVVARCSTAGIFATGSAKVPVYRKLINCRNTSGSSYSTLTCCVHAEWNRKRFFIGGLQTATISRWAEIFELSKSNIRSQNSPFCWENRNCL